jgi:hypothetical protein
MYDTQAIDTVAMRELSIDHRPTGVTQVTGLVSGDGMPWTWFETTTFSGYYCDEEECPDDYTSECDAHPKGYWEEAMRRQWITSIRDRGLRPVVNPDLVREELGLSVV